jgi:hypothetical protein
MRYLLAFLVVAAGCVATLPSDNSVSADLAAETARMIVQMRHEPAPTPAPPKPVVPAGKCPKCLGTGKLSTDGRIVIPCSACNGTGKACSDGRCQ